jgi:hypothetical protein
MEHVHDDSASPSPGLMTNVVDSLMVSDLSLLRPVQSPLYTPLRGKGQVRLLRLSLDVVSLRDHIEAHVLVAELENRPFYFALLYCWGEREHPKAITLNGRQVNIILNLFYALAELGRLEVRTIWIYALCINQDDPVERAYQVSQMAQIYTQAKSVFAWLEPADKQSDHVMDLLRTGRFSQPSLGFKNRFSRLPY